MKGRGSIRVGHGGRDAVGDLAREAGCSTEELVLARILSRSPTTVPIPGASRTGSIESSARAVKVGLGEEMQRRVEEAFGEP